MATPGSLHASIACFSVSTAKLLRHAERLVVEHLRRDLLDCRRFLEHALRLLDDARDDRRPP